MVIYNSDDGVKKIETIILDERKTNGCQADRNGIQTVKINVTVPSVPPSGFIAVNHICTFNYKFRVKTFQWEFKKSRNL